MKKPKIHNMIMYSMFMMLALPFCATVQGEEMAPIPHHKEPYVVKFDVRENLEVETSTTFRDTVVISGVPWMQLHFGDFNLGERSYITMISLHDGSQQRLDSKAMLQWRNSSAYFNGDSVNVELHVAPGEKGIFFSIAEVTVGEWVGEAEAESAGTEEICGTADNRVSSNDRAVGRIMPVGCTGWIVSNGGNLTAGHCWRSGSQVLQFNVPSSLNDGTPVNPPAVDQYPITYTGRTPTWSVGNDWAVFRTGTNSIGQRAIERQGAFYRMTRDGLPVFVRVTGFGLDGPPPLFGDGPRNADSQTLQTHVGAFVSETVVSGSDAEIRHRVDTENANSGSPVINTVNNVTIGIHTNAGCTSSGGSNAGTGFENNNLEGSIQTFPGANVEYVDKGHPVAFENGNVFRPFNTVLEGVNAASSGAIVSIVTGTYNENVTINKAITLQAPVGTVTIK